MRTKIPNDDLIPVSKFITESERNLEIATAIYEQYEAARDEIVKGFVDRLTKDLEAKLDGWVFQCGSLFIERWAGFDFFKKAWKANYRIRLEAYEHGESMGFGVWRDPKALRNVPRSPQLLAAVREEHSEATSRSYFEAEIPMRSPASCWKTPQILWRMQNDENFREEVAALLLNLAGIAEKHVDALVKTALKPLKS